MLRKSKQGCGIVVANEPTRKRLGACLDVVGLGFHVTGTCNRRVCVAWLQHTRPRALCCWQPGAAQTYHCVLHCIVCGRLIERLVHGIVAAYSIGLWQMIFESSRRRRRHCRRRRRPLGLSGLLVPVVECTFPLLLVSVISRVLPRALLCAAIAALCNTPGTVTECVRAIIERSLQ
jgi:hypothetical protein